MSEKPDPIARELLCQQTGNLETLTNERDTFETDALRFKKERDEAKATGREIAKDRDKYFHERDSLQRMIDGAAKAIRDFREKAGDHEGDCIFDNYTGGSCSLCSESYSQAEKKLDEFLELLSAPAPAKES